MCSWDGSTQGDYIGRRTGCPRAVQSGSSSGTIPVSLGVDRIEFRISKLVEGGIKEQTKQVLDNLRAVLKEAGMDYDNVVRATVYLSDMNNFQSMNSVYKGYFNSPHPPARSTIEVQLLPKGTLVEIDLIAME